MRAKIIAVLALFVLAIAVGGFAFYNADQAPSSPDAVVMGAAGGAGGGSGSGTLATSMYTKANADLKVGAAAGSGSGS